MDSLVTLTFTALLLFIIYFSSYMFSLFSNCDDPSLNTYIPEKECCEGTWTNLYSSVNLTLVILTITVLVTFGIFWWIYSRFYSTFMGNIEKTYSLYTPPKPQSQAPSQPQQPKIIESGEIPKIIESGKMSPSELKLDNAPQSINNLKVPVVNLPENPPIQLQEPQNKTDTPKFDFKNAMKSLYEERDKILKI
jgi:hypothetical protein